MSQKFTVTPADLLLTLVSAAFYSKQRCVATKRYGATKSGEDTKET